VQVRKHKVTHFDEILYGLIFTFVSLGLPNAKRHPIFEGLSAENGFYTSKDFLPMVAAASKPGYRIPTSTY